MLTAMDALIDFSAMAGTVAVACPRADHRKGGRPAYATEVLVRMVFLLGPYNLLDVRYQLIRQSEVTPANADDGQQLPVVLQVANQTNRE